MSEKQDRRSQRTRHLLSEALVQLIREKDYNAITVSDIIERANVGRSTFYAHYRDKDDLFVGELDRVIDILSRGIHHETRDDDWFFPSLGLFRHVGEEYELYKALLWGSGIDLLIQHLQKSLSKRIELGLQGSGREFNVPIPVLGNFISGSFLTLLKWWLENKMIYSPEEMNEIFKSLTTTGIEAQQRKR
ncbi:MAG TPA: TetR/AcrR family transcriptional regulator [Anaerolineales bacterium]|nr:TetR/AcrR family transcriptional regulator [Anaerolineales bacterium]